MWDLLSRALLAMIVNSGVYRLAVSCQVGGDSCICREFINNALQHFELFAHFGQLAEGGLLEFLIAFGRGGNADHSGAVGYVVSNAGHSAKHGAIADMH